MQETPVWVLAWEDPLEKGGATHSSMLRLPWWLSWSRICLQCRKPGFDPWVGKIPWRREWLPTAVFRLGEFHWQRTLAGYSSWSLRVRHNWATFTFSLEMDLILLKLPEFFWIGTSSSPFYLLFPMFSSGIWNIWFSKTDQTSWFILFFSLLLMVL